MAIRNRASGDALSEEYENAGPASEQTSLTTIDEGDLGAYINKALAGIEDSAIPMSRQGLIAYAVAQDGEIIEFEGSPWEVLQDKSKLVSVPFTIADVRWYNGNFGPAVAVMLMTDSPLPGTRSARYVINDGSTGLYEQVVGMVKRTGRKRGIDCPRGLRASTYDYTDDQGHTSKATTYYVA